MPRLPRITAKDLISILKKEGFFIARIVGSHYILKHEDGRRTVVPVHAKEIIGPGLFRKILSDCELTCEKFFDLMER